MRDLDDEPTVHRFSSAGEVPTDCAPQPLVNRQNRRALATFRRLNVREAEAQAHGMPDAGPCNAGDLAAAEAGDPAALHRLHMNARTRLRRAEAYLARLRPPQRLSAPRRLQAPRQRSRRAPRRVGRPAARRAASKAASGSDGPAGDGPPRPTPPSGQDLPGAASVHGYTDTPIHALARRPRRRLR